MKKQRPRIKAAKVTISTVAASLRDREAVKRQHFKEFILPLAKIHFDSGKDWRSAKRMAAAEHRIFGSQLTTLINN